MRVLGGLLFLAVPLAQSCLPPTQVTLVLTTDANCADIHGVEIVVGADGNLGSLPPAATTSRCENGTIGTLVLVPSGRGEKIGVQVVAGFGVGKTADQCVPPYGKGCIVARRLVGFVRHSKLTLPINLSASCDGIPCEPSYTCVQGLCVPADVPPACAMGGSCDPDPVAFSADCGDTTGIQAAGPWAMTGMCATHIARSPYAVASKPKFRWRLPKPFSSMLNSSPSVRADGAVVFGTPTGELMLVEGKTGALIRSLPLPGNTGVNGNPGITASGDISVSASSQLVGVNANAMTVKWNQPYPQSSDVTIGPGATTWTVHNPVVLIGVDAAGKVILDFSIMVAGSGPRRAPAIGLDGTIYVAGGDGMLTAVDPKGAGTMLWQHTVGQCGTVTSDLCTSIPVVTKDKVLVTAYASLAPTARELVAFDAKTGMSLPAWTKPGASGCAPVIGADGTVYASLANQVAAFDGASAAMKWSTDVGDVPLECALDASGALVVLTNSTLVAVDTQTRAIRWSVPGQSGTSFALGADGSVFLLTSTNDIVAMGY